MRLRTGSNGSSRTSCRPSSNAGPVRPRSCAASTIAASTGSPTGLSCPSSSIRRAVDARTAAVSSSRSSRPLAGSGVGEPKPVLGQRARLVRGDDGRAPERLDRSESANDRPPRGHLTRAQRQGDRDRRGQSLRDCGDGDRDSDQERLLERGAASEHRAAESERHDDSESDHQPCERADTALQGRERRLRLLRQARDLAQLRGRARCRDDPAATAARHRRARVGHRRAFCQRGFEAAPRRPPCRPAPTRRSGSTRRRRGLPHRRAVRPPAPARLLEARRDRRARAARRRPRALARPGRRSRAPRGPRGARAPRSRRGPPGRTREPHSAGRWRRSRPPRCARRSRNETTVAPIRSPTSGSAN